MRLFGLFSTRAIVDRLAFPQLPSSYEQKDFDTPLFEFKEEFVLVSHDDDNNNDGDDDDDENTKTNITTQRFCEFPLVVTRHNPENRTKDWIMYFHGNASDLGMNRRVAADMVRTYSMDVISIEYPGYGISKESVSFSSYPVAPFRSRSSGLGCMETRCDFFANSAYCYCVNQLGYDPSRAVFYGFSIGGSVACSLASTVSRIGLPPRVLVIHSGFFSMKQMAVDVHTLLSVLVDKRFDNGNRLKELPDCVKIVIVHGLLDQIITYRHALRLKNLRPECKLISYHTVGHDIFVDEEIRKALSHSLDS
jgi:hypothetical protein